MTDLEFLLTLNENKCMWVVSNKESHYNDKNFMNKKFAFISVQEINSNLFNNYLGILLYYKNELPFNSSDLICLLFKIDYFWTDMQKQIFYERVILANLILFDDEIFNYIKNKFNLTNLFNKNKIDISNEDLICQRIIKTYNA